MAAGPAGEYHRAFGPPWQLDASGVVLLALRPEDNYLLAAPRLSLAWLAADRWTGTVSSAYTWFDDDRTHGPTAGDSWSWSARAG